MNGRKRDADAGIVLAAGGGHQVLVNTIGWTTVNQGNQGAGILIFNSSANSIGGSLRAFGNKITFNSSHGILLRGPANTRNQLAFNSIGTSNGRIPEPNAGDGIRLDDAAAQNRIGGDLPVTLGTLSYSVPLENTIAFNTGDGIRMIGSATTGNSILNNIITANFGLGIRLVGGGNSDMAPPLYLGYDDFTLSGTVPDLDATPPGSIVQVFSDPDPSVPEGAVLLGESFVRKGGAFTVRLLKVPIFPNITLTATHAANRSTSPFGSGHIIPLGFHLERNGPAVASNVSAGATQTTILPLLLTAFNDDVRVESLVIEATGSLPAPGNITGVQLFRDRDQSGGVTIADTPISGVALFDPASNRVSLTLSNAFVGAGSPERWIVVGSLAAGATSGMNFQFRVVDATSVRARFVSSSGTAVPTPPFPVESAVFSVGPGRARSTLANWKQIHFSPAQRLDPFISGDLANPDGDLASNFAEYSFGLDPLRSGTDTDGARLKSTIAAVIEIPGSRSSSYFTFSFTRRTEPVDLLYVLETSSDLKTWKPVPESSVALDTAEPLGTRGDLQHVTYRTQSSLETAGQPGFDFYRVRVRYVP
ncbi:MAG: right-handed parallel beta-helix repeat-containing protein [Pedosphaera sp.]|nr:right-handed parallel beta-helix repeat-containing protein [Pedosphaera sp.]